ncbi:MAG: cobalamin-dependent protein [Trueperaceae bacterium]|nr:cobalamin-dependent protein [Trueperaceae bacterium]
MGRGKFTVNEVEERTGVPAATLRQWERRYGFPLPERSDAGYRLYSDDDIRCIAAMKRHIADGVPASRAAELAKNLPGPHASGEGRPASALRDDLVDALVELDDHAADRVLGEAHALHPVEAVMTDVLQPTMLEIGQRWHDGTLATTTEHFASSYVQGRLRALLSLAGQHRRSPGVIVACAPLDQHELGALMLAVMLRRRGYRVTYVGANTPVADLAAMARDTQPLALMISASTQESLNELRARQELLASAAPIVVFGGPVFNHDPSAAEELGGHYLAESVVSAVDRFDELVRHHEVGVA